jgi:hypothetical protein
MSGAGSPVVKHLPHHFKVKGLSPSQCWHQEKMVEKEKKMKLAFLERKKLSMLRVDQDTQEQKRMTCNTKHYGSVIYRK